MPKRYLHLYLRRIRGRFSPVDTRLLAREPNDTRSDSQPTTPDGGRWHPRCGRSCFHARLSHKGAAERPRCLDSAAPLTPRASWWQPTGSSRKFRPTALSLPGLRSDRTGPDLVCATASRGRRSAVDAAAKLITEGCGFESRPRWFRGPATAGSSRPGTNPRGMACCPVIPRQLALIHQ
jgi:hypothetical protein